MRSLLLVLLLASPARAAISSLTTMPGGKTGNVQFNNGGRFDGVAGSTVAGQSLGISGKIYASSAAFGTTDLVTDAVNHRVGIGTTSPDDILDVEGGDIRITTRTGGGVHIVDAQRGNNWYFTGDTTGAGIGYTKNGTRHIELSESNLGVSFGGNVGIGTASPGAKLDVLGAAGTPSYANGITTVRDNNGFSLVVGHKNSGTYPFWIQGVNTVNDTDKWPISLNPLGGYIGVGPATPNDTLHLSAAGQVGAVWDRTDGSPSSGTIRNAGGAFVFNYWNPSGSGLSFQTNAQEKMRINPDGNIGIGTASPATTLDVNGAATVGGVLNVNGTGSSLDYDFQLDNDDTTAYLFGSRNSSIYKTFKFYSSSAGGSLGMTVNQASVTVSGRFGIGTTSPAKPFVISTTDTEPMRIIGGGTSHQFSRWTNTGGETIWGLEGSAGNTALTGGLPYASILASNAAKALQLGTNGTANLTILSGGNVGIGTASPGATLDVAGSFRINNNASIASGEGMEFGYAAGLGTIQPYDRTNSLERGFNLAGSTVSFYTNGSKRLTAITNGNIGIATAAPDAPLTVIGNSSLGVLKASGTQLYYCTAGTQAGMLMRGSGTIAVVCTASTGLGIYVP
jgi:hypothetical protein